MTTLANVVDALSRANCHPTSTGNDAFSAHCPVHEVDGGGHKPSLSVSRGDKVDVVVHCHAGCSPAAIFAALGIETSTRRKAGTSTTSGRRIVACYPYHDHNGTVIFEKIRFQPKDFRIRHRDASGAEVWKLPRGTEPPLYRLPDVLAAIASGEPVYLVEGEKDADKLAAAGLCATTNYDGAAAGKQKAKWRASYAAALAGADVVLLPDNDEPGRSHMRHAAAALAGTAARVRWLELPELPDKGDVSDWLTAGHTVEELVELADATAPDATTSTSTSTSDTTSQPDADATAPDADATDDDEAEIERLAALAPMQYDRERAAAAKRLGIRADTLDKAVKLLLEQSTGTSNGGGGTALVFDEVEPWPEPVDGAALLDSLASSVKRHLSLPDHTPAAIALWTLASHIIVDHGHIAPLMAITSPEKRCGKSTLLGWLYRLVNKPLVAANITAAAIFRVMDMCKPTLLIDEADSFLGETGDELRGILNSGHTKELAYVFRCCGDDSEVRRFSTWGSKAIALIGKLEGKYSTLADRSIEVQLRRKLPSERLMKLRHADEKHFENLARQCRRFAMDNGAAIGKARPDIPDALNDRAADNWEPMFSIADTSGGHWPRLARTVALALSGGADTGTSTSTAGDSLGVQLLSDLRRHFDGGNSTSYPTAELLRYLSGIDEAPWPTFAKGKPMTARHLSRLLHPYGILPRSIRISATDTPKGYIVADFADAFRRYLPSNRNNATSQSTSGFPADDASATDTRCGGYANTDEASQQAACGDVADKTAGTRTAGAGVAETDENWL